MTTVTSASPQPVVLGGEPGRRLPAMPWPIAGEREADYLQRVVEGDQWDLEGPFETGFERAFAELQTAKFGLTVANGTVALQLALEALDIGFGDEVIVPGFTWQATAAAALDVNAVPVLVDADPDTYCPDPGLVEAAITPRTKAIIVVHLYSGLTDLDAIREIARRHQLFLIEDCAHSHGSQWSGRGVGSVGDLGTFSFQASKLLTAGEGGFVTTNDPALYERLYSLRSCGRRRVPFGRGASDDRWQPIQSGNYRLSEFQAAVLSAQLERFDEQMTRRESNAAFLDAGLAEIPGIRPLHRQPQVTRRNSYQYAFRYDPDHFAGLSGPAFRRALSAELGVEVDQPYVPLNQSPLFQPGSKRRHHLSPEYVAAIDPTQYDLPIAQHAHETEGMLIAHQVLLADPSELALVPEAVLRLQEHASELAKWEQAAADRIGPTASAE